MACSADVLQASSEKFLVGEDAVLLIAAALEPEKCNELAEKAHELGLEVLLEIHSSEELI